MNVWGTSSVAWLISRHRLGGTELSKDLILSPATWNFNDVYCVGVCFKPP